MEVEKGENNFEYCSTDLIKCLVVMMKIIYIIIGLISYYMKWF